MFIVTIAGKKQLFLNSKNDDFLRFIAEKYDVEASEISAEYVPDEEQKAIRRTMKLNPDKLFDFDLEAKKLVQIIPPIANVGSSVLDERHPLNKKMRDNADVEQDSKAKNKTKFEQMTDDDKKAYLLAMTWAPRKWEAEAYAAIVGTGGIFRQVKADDVEVTGKKIDVVQFTTKKIKEVRYKKQKNKITGIEETVLDEMIFEEGV